jgi:aerobic-type carbon monoxide dehydrogenase small subunit (CoxS/CutS family)
MEGKRILTVEGLKAGERLHPIQKAFSEHGGYQCGYCTPGQMMAAKALLDKNPTPSREEVRVALSGNLCRCGAYPKIIESVLAAASKG